MHLVDGKFPVSVSALCSAQFNSMLKLVMFTLQHPQTMLLEIELRLADIFSFLVLSLAVL